VPIVGIVLVLRHQVYASFGYHVQAAVDTWPSDDEALREWLLQQPGVVKHTLRIDRSEQDLEIFFIQSRNLAGDPPFPDLDPRCRMLGYGDKVEFRDVRPR